MTELITNLVLFVLRALPFLRVLAIILAVEGALASIFLITAAFVLNRIEQPKSGYRRFLPLSDAPVFLKNASHMLTKWSDFGFLSRLAHRMGTVQVNWLVSILLRLPYLALVAFAGAEMLVRVTFGMAYLGLFGACYCVTSIAVRVAAAVTRAVDKLFFMRMVRFDCPSCKRSYQLPLYLCPHCGAEHADLYPGAYGVFRKRCSCGRRIPIAALSGRNELEAKCTSCGAMLPTGGVPQVALQLAGGPRSGKSAYLAAFMHQYLGSPGGKRSWPQPAFERMEKDFSAGVTTASSSRNGDLYAAIGREGRKDRDMLALYDIDGMAFVDGEFDGVPAQFDSCDGFLLMIDPLASAQVRAENSIADGQAYSTESVDSVVNGFLNKFVEMKSLGARAISDIPLSVVLTKCDIPSLYGKLNPEYLREMAHAECAGDLQQARDKACMGVLAEMGYGNVINSLASRFREVRYFPLSAIGHAAGNGQPYQPWGIQDPADWIIQRKWRRK